ncbi:ubiquitin carboxyl-terminal hydrolase 19 [Raphanus sativus]|uniref:Ubiquitin carboxyl-terminal hydrolase 19 n=1 Tax=Raphanus sativus TaxID=3726 RepID=A0A6J0JQP9_RAPSA|nr:ubiquitin carboxyl-terminal hydrolase 19 [Raphanus sativus]XP_018437869.1 ubiquitin carboxyl-terminal hydrolase 19 [Raphanus sativus]
MADNSGLIIKPGDVLFPYETFVQYFNCCFAYVVLQYLSWTLPLVAYLLERGHKRECRRNDWCFLLMGDRKMLMS